MYTAFDGWWSYYPLYLIWYTHTHIHYISWYCREWIYSHRCLHLYVVPRWESCSHTEFRGRSRGGFCMGFNPPPPPNGQSQQYKMQYYNIVVLSHGDALIYIKVAGSGGQVLTICKATLEAICGTVYIIWSWHDVVVAMPCWVNSMAVIKKGYVLN